jgi:hypothetical protein
MMAHEQMQSMANNAELRAQLDRLSRKLEYLYRDLNISYPDDDVPTYVIEARELVLQGRDADAVKIVREHTAVGIIEARSIVEDLRRRLARSPLPQQQNPAFSDVPQGTQASRSVSTSAW